LAHDRRAMIAIWAALLLWAFLAVTGSYGKSFVSGLPPRRLPRLASAVHTASIASTPEDVALDISEGDLMSIHDSSSFDGEVQQAQRNKKKRDFAQNSFLALPVGETGIVFPMWFALGQQPVDVEPPSPGSHGNV